MAEYVAKERGIPTVGEVISFVAVRGGLVRTDENPKDPVYENLKHFVREQKGRDFAQLEEVLEAMERRFEEYFAPVGLGEIIFNAFRSFILRYIQFLYHGRSNFLGRERATEENLIPKFFIPSAAFLLKSLNDGPFSFIELDEMLRSDSPLKVAFRYSLNHAGKDWMDLASIYLGKNETYHSREADHDIEDNKKLIRKWGLGQATPDMYTCLTLLEGLGCSQYSGVVFWVWVGRFLQKIDKRYRVLIAEAVEDKAPIPTVQELALELTHQNDRLGRQSLSHKEQLIYHRLDALLYQNNPRNLGDKRRVEDVLKLADEIISAGNPIRFHVIWSKARYYLYSRDFDNALASYEQAFYEGMYGESIAENLIIREWAAVAQKVGNKSVLKRINSRMKFFRFYPVAYTEDDIVRIRLGDYNHNFGSERFFIEAFY